MTLYRDAELAAIAALRLTMDEDVWVEPESEKMCALANDMMDRYGRAGIHALVGSLARHFSIAFSREARSQNTTAVKLLDQIEWEKLVEVDEEAQEQT